MKPRKRKRAFSARTTRVETNLQSLTDILSFQKPFFRKAMMLFAIQASGLEAGKAKNLVHPWPRPRKTSCSFQDIVLKDYGVHMQIQSNRARAGL
jgi:hypothetical protein